MSQMRLIRNYSSYNVWANAVFVNYLKTKPYEILSQAVVSSFPSIIKTLSHILDAQEFWISVISGTKDHHEVPNAERHSPGEVLDLLVASSTKLESFLSNLNAVELEKEISTPWLKNKIPICEIFQHCFNHSTYHRGQLVTLSKQFGFEDIPATDYDYYLKIMEESNET
jgi:uncharacterized damage-inducible protein DinB